MPMYSIYCVEHAFILISPENCGGGSTYLEMNDFNTLQVSTFQKGKMLKSLIPGHVPSLQGLRMDGWQAMLSIWRPLSLAFAWRSCCVPELTHRIPPKTVNTKCLQRRYTQPAVLQLSIMNCVFHRVSIFI